MSPRNVLIVDDYPDTADSLSILLTIAGYQTTVARSGEEAIAKASVNRPDVVVLDIGLGRISGLDVCRTLRKQNWCSNTVIIAVTGLTSPKVLESLAEAGCDAHLIKPAEPAALCALIERLYRIVHQRTRTVA